MPVPRLVYESALGIANLQRYVMQSGLGHDCQLPVVEAYSMSMTIYLRTSRTSLILAMVQTAIFGPPY
jgi:hypothetical protein